MSKLLMHAKRELELMGFIIPTSTPWWERVLLKLRLKKAPPFDPNAEMAKDILAIVEMFGNQGHSGFSAAYAIGVVEKLLRFEPVKPLTGDEDEWNDISEFSGNPTWQNKRCSRVFKDADGRAYDIDGRVFREPNGACFTSRDSRVYIEFPYTPKTEYVDVPASV